MWIARTPIPCEAARRAVVHALVEVLVEIIFGEERDVLQIAQRRHGALTLRAAVLAAELHRPRVRRTVSVCRVVTARARLPMRSRQCGIEKELPAQRFERSDRRM